MKLLLWACASLCIYVCVCVTGKHYSVYLNVFEVFEKKTCEKDLFDQKLSKLLLLTIIYLRKLVLEQVL